MSLIDFYIIYILAILPAALITYYVYQKDFFPEDISEVVVTFLLGSSIVLFLHLLIPLAESISVFFFSDVAKHAYFSFFRAATLEECMKFFVVYFYCYKLSNFNEPMDAIVFSTAASLGFAAIENIDYVMSARDENIAFDVAILRAFSAIPLHAFCGVVMGLFLGLSIFSSKNNSRFLTLSLAAPIFIHGLYNFILSVGFGFLIYIFLIFLLIKLSEIVEKLRADQTQKENETVDRVYEIKFNDIFSNILRITGVIIVGTLSLDVIFT